MQARAEAVGTEIRNASAAAANIPNVDAAHHVPPRPNPPSAVVRGARITHSVACAWLGGDAHVRGLWSFAAHPPFAAPSAGKRSNWDTHASPRTAHSARLALGALALVWSRRTDRPR